MRDALVVKLPYPNFSIFGINISVKKEIGFLFNNQSIYNFRENNNLNTSLEYDAWIKQNGETVLITEMMYGAAQAYCNTMRKKQTFTKPQLTQAIAAADTATQKAIVDGWRKSQTFGAVELKKKQKKSA